MAGGARVTHLSWELSGNDAIAARVFRSPRSRALKRIGFRRVTVVYKVASLRGESSNQLLKTLEEGNDHLERLRARSALLEKSLNIFASASLARAAAARAFIKIESGQVMFDALTSDV